MPNNTARKRFANDVKNTSTTLPANTSSPRWRGFGGDVHPSEAVFAEIVGNHPDIVAQAQAQRVWMTSPTNLMAVLHTVRAVIRDAEMRNSSA